MSRLDSQVHVLVINGPNLDRLGKRQPAIYGNTTLADLETDLTQKAEKLGVEISFVQSNHEGELIEAVHDAADKNWPIVINPGGFTHTSVALRDALAEVSEGSGFVEVHISNIFARESFRQHSFLSPLATGVISGLGIAGYELALEFLVNHMF